MKLRRQAIILVLCPWLFQAVLTAILIPQLYQSQARLARQLKDEDTLSLCGELITSIGNASVMAASTKGMTFDKKEVSFDMLIHDVEKKAGMLTANLKTAGYQQAFVEKIEHLNRDLTESIKEFRQASFIAFGDNQRRYGPVAISTSCDMLMLKMAKLGKQLGTIMSREEQRLAAGQKQVRAEEIRWRQQAIAIAAIGLAISILLTLIIIRKLFGELKALNNSIAAFSSAQKPSRKLKGSSELAKLERTVYDVSKVTLAAIARDNALINNATAMVCALDQSGNFLKSNNYCYQLLGYEAEELLGKSLVEIAVLSDYRQLLQIIEDACEAETTRTFDLKLAKHDRTVQESEWTVHWSKEDQALFCVVTDATERRHLERLKEDFLAMISHDLRTPLMSIVTGLATLNHARTAERENFSPAARAQLAQAEAQITGLIVLVNNLLDFEKMQAGRMAIVPSKIQLNQILLKSLDNVAEKAERKELNILLTKEASAHWAVLADQALLEQMLNNLLQLAVEASPPGGTITIDAQAEEAELVLKLTAPIDDQPLTNSPKTNDKLALEVCRLIAAAHQTSLQIKPVKLKASEGQKSSLRGTSFSFSLPRYG